VIAVSVVEHIGLENPHVNIEMKPAVGDEGDIAAVRELARVISSNGYLLMTLPFGPQEGLILNRSARNYTIQRIAKLDEFLERVELHYYEYQFRSTLRLFEEYPESHNFFIRFRKWLKSDKKVNSPDIKVPKLPGVVTWRRIPLEEAKATHKGHTNGVLCGKWRKK
jgi:hypothetical protein